MPFITLGTASELQIKVPTVGSTDWGDTLRTDTFLKIAQHDHTGSGNGANIAGGALANDSITGAKIRLDNNEYLKARNQTDTDNINIIKVGTTNHLELGAPFKNNTFITARDQADSADINVWKINAADEIEFGADIEGIVYKHDTYFQADNSGGTPTNLFKLDANNDFTIDPDISKLIMKNNVAIQSDNAGGTPVDMIKLDASDELVINPDVNKLVMKHDTYIQADNSGGTPTNLIKLDTSNELVIDPDVNKLVMKNNTWIQSDNSGGTPSSLIKLNASDKIELGANVVSASIETLSSGDITMLNTAALADAQATTSAGIVSLGTDEACTIHYNIKRGGSTQVGTLQFTDVDTLPAETYTGVDVGVTFTVSSGVLQYATTSTGSAATMTYTVIKE